MKRLRQYIRQILLEQRNFYSEGDRSFFRVNMTGIGRAYAQGGSTGSFDLCKDDIEAIKKMPGYQKAKEHYEANNTTGQFNWETKTREEVPATFYPKFYYVANAWIDDEQQRGQGHGKAIYEEWIRKATEYSRGYGGVFIAGAHCVQTEHATSNDAKRVWKSLVKDYPLSSGLVIFIPLQ